jgi:glutathione peroxidase
MGSWYNRKDNRPLCPSCLCAKKMKKLKRFTIVLLMLAVAFIGYVAIVNRNSKNMTYRQKVLKAIYPALMWYNKISGKKSKVMENSEGITTLKSLHNLSVHLNTGEDVDLLTFKGKKILLVNTASNCGYTNQYDDLQKLYETYKDKLMIIGFPANDFKEQEKGTDQEIAEFCKVNFGITFPLATKSSVVKGKYQNKIFKWLTDETLNGWNDQQPTWNFCKYLVDENGKLIKYFDTAVSPLDEEVKNAIDL